VSLERLAPFVLSIPEGVVERRTAVHPVRAFTSIGRDCVGCFIDTWKGDCLGSSSRGQPRGALPLHQVMQRQFIKFTDPTRRSGYTCCLGVCTSLPVSGFQNPNPIVFSSSILHIHLAIQCLSYLFLLVLRLLAGQVPSWLGCRAPQDHVDHGSWCIGR
jgi:hypothetical protein